MRSIYLLFVLVLFAGLFGGCAQMNPAAQIALTPFTAIRDTVDAPLVTLANYCEWGARKTKPESLTPSAGVGIGLHGPTAGIGLNLTYFTMKVLSWTFGGVDYVLCRSLYPNYPEGISPWKTSKQPWGSLYYPNTRFLWGEELYANPSPQERPIIEGQRADANPSD